MWAPDAAEKGGKYYLYFPVKDKEGHRSHRRGSGRQPCRSVQGAARSPSRTASAWTRPCSRTTTASTTCTSADLWGGQLQHWKTGELHSRTTRSRRMTSRAAAEDRALDDEHGRVRREAEGRRDRRREGQAAARPAITTAASSKRRGCTSTKGQLLLLVLDRRHALHRVCAWASLRTVRSRTGQDPRARAWLDEPPFDRGVQASGTCSITTPNCQVKRTCATSRWPNSNIDLTARSRRSIRTWEIEVHSLRGSSSLPRSFRINPSSHKNIKGN